MREVTTKVYQFSELSDDAKEVARQWYRDTADEYFWLDEGLNSIKAFCNLYGVTITDYSFSICGHSYIETDATNQHFRGLKLKAVDREAMPTGYCMDCSLSNRFYDEFKRTGDALSAFNESIELTVRDIIEDWEASLEDEAVDETIEANQYEFTEDGKIY